LEQAKNRLKPELQAGEGWIGRCSEFGFQAVGRQNEQAKREGRVAGAMNLISFVTGLQPFVDEFMGRTARRLAATVRKLVAHGLKTTKVHV
jgi:hypothetical protein